jgi:hypothetical protein
MKSINNINNKRLAKVMRFLTFAYNQKEKLEVGDMWQTRVMGHVLSLGPLCTKTNYFELFQQFVWKLTPVTFLLIGLLGLALVKMDFYSDYEFTKSFVSTSTDFITLAMNSGS